MADPEVVIVTEQTPRVIVREAVALPVGGGGGGPEADPIALAALAAHDTGALGAVHEALSSELYATLVAYTDTQVGALSSGLAAALDGKVATTGGGLEAVHAETISADHTVSLAAANVHDLTLAADLQLALSGATDGRACTVTLLLRQDATGGRELTWPAEVEWVGGSAPTLQPDPEATDVVTLLSVDGGANWLGFHASGGGGGAVEETDPVAGAALAAHLADGTDAHDASAISFSPAGTIAATDVQAAIAEVAAEGGGSLDPDLAAIAALSTTAYGRGLLELADAAAARAALQIASLQPSYRTGEYYACRGTLSGAGTGAMTQSRAYYLPFVVFKSQAFDRIAAHISGTGSAGSVVRLGIYADNGGGRPGALVVDAGTVATDSGTGIKAATISQTLAPGLYWLTVCPQTAGSATYTRIVPFAEGGWLNANFNGNVLTADAVTGAFAANLPPDGVTLPTAAALNPPIAALRAA